MGMRDWNEWTDDRPWEEDWLSQEPAVRVAALFDYWRARNLDDQMDDPEKRHWMLKAIDVAGQYRIPMSSDSFKDVERRAWFLAYAHGKPEPEKGQSLPDDGRDYESMAEDAAERRSSYSEGSEYHYTRAQQGSPGWN